MATQPATKKRPTLLIVIGGVIAICVFCVIASFAMDALGLLPETTPIPTSTERPTAIPPTITSTPNPAQAYLDEYGGTLAAYNEIFALTDCKTLQEKFETAYANNQRETPGTPLFKVALGYMLATDDHMKSIGCY